MAKSGGGNVSSLVGDATVLDGEPVTVCVTHNSRINVSGLTAQEIDGFRQVRVCG